MLKITVLTGAGISAESGIPTFRDKDGLWNGARPEDVSSREALIKTPERVREFYNDRRRQIKAAQPNDAHQALALLSQSACIQLYLVTQNVDDLHERAGNTAVHHIHGEVFRQRCGQCERVSEIAHNMHHDDLCQQCGAKGQMRPHIVMFGEIPFDFDGACKRCVQSDVFISVGTSGLVYPAASLAQLAHHAGVTTVCINRQPEAQVDFFDYTFYGPAGKILPSLAVQLAQVKNKTDIFPLFEHLRQAMSCQKF